MVALPIIPQKNKNVLRVIISISHPVRDNEPKVEESLIRNCLGRQNRTLSLPLNISRNRIGDTEPVRDVRLGVLSKWSSHPALIYRLSPNQGNYDLPHAGQPGSLFPFPARYPSRPVSHRPTQLPRDRVSLVNGTRPTSVQDRTFALS